MNRQFSIHQTTCTRATLAAGHEENPQFLIHLTIYLKATLMSGTEYTRNLKMFGIHEGKIHQIMAKEQQDMIVPSLRVDQTEEC